MHLTRHDDVRPAESVDQLREYLESGCKPASKWLLGTEFELFGVRLAQGAVGTAPGYDDPDGMRAVLERLIAEQGWSPIHENDYIIALVRGNSQITFEPGGQLELAAKPVEHADVLADMIRRLAGQLLPVAEQFNLAWLGLGFQPFGAREAIPWMRKERYGIMRDYMPTVGNLGHDMMKRTATVQVNLDFSDADDAGDKLRAIMSATSIMTALFASSPIVESQDSGYASYRAHVWTDTDPDRSGLLDFAFADGNIFSAYTEYALDVPMYFVHRDDHYIAARNLTFRRFMREGFQGHSATMDDWALHLSTLFPEARMKKLIEVRGCDCGSPDMILALGPLCRALFYDADARAATIALTASLDLAERHALVKDVARHGLGARAKGRTVHELARELLAIATDSLKRQAPSELRYLQPVQAIIESGRTQADELRDLWRDSGGDPTALIARTAHIRPVAGQKPTRQPARQSD